MMAKTNLKERKKAAKKAQKKAKKLHQAAKRVPTGKPVGYSPGQVVCTAMHYDLPNGEVVHEPLFLEDLFMKPEADERVFLISGNDFDLRDENLVTIKGEVVHEYVSENWAGWPHREVVVLRYRLPDGRIFEDTCLKERLLMKARRDQYVYYKDGNVMNNDLDNLQLIDGQSCDYAFGEDPGGDDCPDGTCNWAA
jgi:hypothetical protein